MPSETRNTYTKKQIANALIELLKENELNKINIIQIIEKAGVSRNSFYRNYNDKEDIIRKHIQYLLKDWQKRTESYAQQSNAIIYGSLFEHLYENRDFYLLVRERNLFHLFLDAFINIFNISSLLDNKTAYGIAFVSYGTYGWIEEWIKRGMVEDAETITKIMLESTEK